MRIGFALAFVGLLSVSCAGQRQQQRARAEIDQILVAGPIPAQSGAPFLRDDPDTRTGCRADDDCARGSVCHPVDKVCMSGGFPSPRMVDITSAAEPSSDPKACRIVPLYFEFDSAELVPEAEQWLTYDARCVQNKGASRLVIEGHADARGAKGYNMDLSRRRAEVVKAALERQGVGLPIEIAAQGEGEPLLPNTSERHFAYNRRVEIQIK